MSEPEILTKKEVAELLRVDETTIEEMMRNGSLPYLKLGKRNPRAKLDRRAVRFQRSAVMTAITSGK